MRRPGLLSRAFVGAIAVMTWMAWPSAAAAHSAGSQPRESDGWRTELCTNTWDPVPPTTAADYRRLLAGDPGELWRQGKACSREGTWDKAYFYLKAAYELTPLWDRAVELALAESQLGLWPDACLHLQDALRKIPESHEFREHVVGRVNAACARVTALTVVVTPEDSCVELDGRIAACGSAAVTEHVHRFKPLAVRVRHPNHPARTIALDGDDMAARSLEIRVDLTTEPRTGSWIPPMVTATAALALLGGGAGILAAPGMLTSEREGAGISLLALGALTSATAGGLFVWHVYAPESDADAEPSDSVHQRPAVDVTVPGTAGLGFALTTRW
jgi:hypothetical protein